MIIGICAALLPVILLFIYIYRQDSKQPEPPKWLWKAVLYGMLSALVALLICPPEVTTLIPELAGTATGAVLTSFINAALPEEAAKLLMLWLLLRKNPYFDEHLDGIVYATCVSLGFAGVENIMYVLENMSDLVSIALMRGVFSVPGHFFFAVAMGYFVSLAHFSSKTRSQRTRHYLLAYFVPVLLHGIFDSLLFSAQVNEVLAVICILAFLYFCHKLRKKGQEHICLMKERDEKMNTDQQA